MSTALAQLSPGQSATVSGFDAPDESIERLMQMGIIEGVDVEVLRYAPAGDPLEIRIMGYALSLRASDARQVLVEQVTNP